MTVASNRFQWEQKGFSLLPSDAPCCRQTMPSTLTAPACDRIAAIAAFTLSRAIRRRKRRWRRIDQGSQFRDHLVANCSTFRSQRQHILEVGACLRTGATSANGPVHFWRARRPSRSSVDARTPATSKHPGHLVLSRQFAARLCAVSAPDV